MTIVLRNSRLLFLGSLLFPPDHKKYSLTGCSVCDAPELSSLRRLGANHTAICTGKNL